jgi:hypothetical protein
MVDDISFFLMFLANYLVVSFTLEKCGKTLEKFIEMASSLRSISGLLTAIPHITTKAGNSKVFRHLANSPTCTRLE